MRCARRAYPIRSRSCSRACCTIAETLLRLYLNDTGLGADGAALIAAAVDWTRDAGYRELTLDVHERNAAAIGSYRRGGFEVVGEFAGDDGREIAMAVRL